jgi:DNA-binding transcriptional MerR regulator
MAHKIAKLMLEQADTFLERTEAVEIALSLGMPLREIEEYLDWLEIAREPRNKRRQSRSSAPSSEPVSDD